MPRALQASFVYIIVFNAVLLTWVLLFTAFWFAEDLSKEPRP